MRLKVTPEDFQVEEVPAYEPSGAGEHLYVTFEKRDLTTREAVARIARALGCEPREAGVAGQKDRRAVTVQTASFFTRAEENAALALDLDGIRVISAKRHGNKLRPGHLHGNLFRIRVRDVSAIELQVAMSRLETLSRDGAPNAFGAQRFGSAGDNHQRARAWLRSKERAPRDKRERAFLFSALQAHVFNRVLARRVEDGTWCRALLGDVMKKREGALFVCTDVQSDDERARRGEISPTGPIFGVKMREPEGEVRALEQEIMRAELEGIDVAKTGPLGEGTRRALRVLPEQLRCEEVTEDASDQRSCVLCFMLPKGAFATVVIEHLFQIQNPLSNEEEEEEG